jgi:hypothetical protein
MARVLVYPAVLAEVHDHATLPKTRENTLNRKERINDRTSVAFACAGVNSNRPLTQLFIFLTNKTN